MAPVFFHIYYHDYWILSYNYELLMHKCDSNKFTSEDVNHKGDTTLYLKDEEVDMSIKH